MWFGLPVKNTCGMICICLLKVTFLNLLTGSVRSNLSCHLHLHLPLKATWQECSFTAKYQNVFIQQEVWNFGNKLMAVSYKNKLSHLCYSWLIMQQHRNNQKYPLYFHLWPISLQKALLNSTQYNNHFTHPCFYPK